MKDENVTKIMESLKEGVRDVFDSGRYQKYLDFVSQFHNYSANNCQLIYWQNPQATYVAGASQWKQRFQRKLKDGERKNAIDILAPQSYRYTVYDAVKDKDGKPLRDENGDAIKTARKVTKVYYKLVQVYDISQTEGKEIPQFAEDLNAEVKDVKQMIQALQDVSPYEIHFTNAMPLRNSKGYCSHKLKRIGVDEDLSDLHKIKTCIHEISHAKLHLSATDSQVAEVEAESVAYVVCKHFGLNTDQYSFDYIAAWSSEKTLPELSTSLKTIQKQSTEMIHGIEHALQKNRDLQLEQTVKRGMEI